MAELEIEHRFKGGRHYRFEEFCTTQLQHASISVAIPEARLRDLLIEVASVDRATLAMLADVVAMVTKAHFEEGRGRG